jgi:hypothetical protein
MRRLRLIATLPLIAAATLAHADVYRTVDAEGHVEYSDRWVPGAELVKTDHGHVTAPSTSQPSEDQKRAVESANERIATQQAQQTVQQDVSAKRTQQCTEAKERYEKAITARRIYRTGKEGEREYLTEEEADQQRLQARLAVQEACGTSPVSK